MESTKCCFFVAQMSFRGCHEHRCLLVEWSGWYHLPPLEPFDKTKAVGFGSVQSDQCGTRNLATIPLKKADGFVKKVGGGL